MFGCWVEFDIDVVQVPSLFPSAQAELGTVEGL